MDVVNGLLKLPADVVIKEKNNKYLLLFPSAPDWIITNGNGAKALSYCDGNNTIDDISKILSNKIKRKNLKSEISNFLGEIYETAVINKDKNNIEIPPYIPKLNIVHISLSSAWKCNLRCVYCYALERMPNSKENFLDFDELCEVVDNANEIGVKPVFTLTGGEPLLSPYALDLAKYIKSKGNTLSIITNGLLLNDEKTKKIAKLVDLLEISIDGSNQEVHELHRGKKSYNKVIKAVELLDKHNVNYQVAMTVTKNNIHDIPNMAKIYGGRLKFQPLFASAGAAKSVSSIEITGDEYYKALNEASNVNPMGVIGNNIGKRRNIKSRKCAISDSEISISEVGDVYPCHMLHINEFAAGNVRTSSLKDIYFNSSKLDESRSLIVDNLEGCDVCDIRYICGGACRARAYYEKGDIKSSGDFCSYERSAVFNALLDSVEIF